MTDHHRIWIETRRPDPSVDDSPTVVDLGCCMCRGLEDTVVPGRLDVCLVGGCVCADPDHDDITRYVVCSMLCGVKVVGKLIERRAVEA